MFSRFPLLIRSFVALALVLAVSAPAPAPATGEAEALERTRAEISEIRKRLAAAKGEAASIKREVTALDRQVDGLDSDIESGEQAIRDLESQIRTAETNIVALEVRQDEAKLAVNERARDLYKKGPADFLNRLFEADNIGEFARLTTFWEIAAELDGRTILIARRLRQDLLDRKEDLSSMRAALEEQRALLEARRRLVAGARLEKSRALAGAESVVAQELSHVRALEAESRRLTAVLQSRLSRSTGEVSRSGFIWPLRGQITSGYGRRGGGFHPGIDIDGNTGDPVVAAKGGVIVPVNCGSGYGICTIIDHGGGVATLYAHFSRKALSAGSVERGAVIGYVGCTGSCTGSHLHFEVRVNGSPQNPMGFLP